jgi:exosortase
MPSSSSTPGVDSVVSSAVSKGPWSVVGGQWSLFRSPVLAIGLFAILWLDLIRQLHYTWDTREQYAYGWFVPFFALFLLWRRWADRPGPMASVSSFKSQVSSLPPPSDLNSQLSTLNSQLRPSGPWSVVLFGSHWSVVSGLVVFLAALLLPLRVIFEINADWPLIAWAYALIVVGLTLYAFYLAGGWPWVRHFAFPVAFILVAVTWPYRIEKGLTQNLMQVVANITVEILGILGVPAVQKGNLIEVATGVVGIDEACSGIRSFQSTFMAGLLMGELYRLRTKARLGLLAGGLLLAFCFNICRTLLLSWQANKEGMSALAKWHAPAGLTITVACFFALWALAGLFTARSGGQGARSREQGAGSAAQKAGDGGQRSAVSNQQPAVRGPWSVARGHREAVSSQWSVVSGPRAFMLVLGFWTLLILAATELWYRSHAIKDEGVYHWSVSLPTNNPSFKTVEMAPRSVKILKTDVAATGSWREADGSDWSAYFFRWNPRSVQTVFRSRLHRPEVCLSAAGLREIGDSTVVVFDISTLKIPFRKYTFEAEGKVLHVFFSQWEDGFEQQAGMRGSKQADRLQSVSHGRRRVGQQTLELVLRGYGSLQAAEDAVRKRLPDLIQAGGRPSRTTADGSFGSRTTCPDVGFPRRALSVSRVAVAVEARLPQRATDIVTRSAEVAPRRRGKPTLSAESV